MTTIVSVAWIARDAAHAARQGRTANPFPEADPAHPIWADCFAAADAARMRPQPSTMHLCGAAECAASNMLAHIGGAL